MTREQAIATLHECAETAARDPEAAHGAADEVLCAFLEAAGFADVVAAYARIRPRWCA